jgi:hypothetical protein
MAEESDAPAYSWTPLEGEAVTAAYVAHAGRAKATYPNGDTYEGTFNDAKQKHGRGVYTWSTAEGANAFVPEDGFPGA